MLDAPAAQVMARSFADAGNKLEIEVLAPLARWQEVHSQLGVSPAPFPRVLHSTACSAPTPSWHKRCWPAVDGTLCVSPLTQHAPATKHAGLRTRRRPHLGHPACPPGSVPGNRELEDARLEVDSRRRTVADLSRRADGLRAHLGKGGDAKQEAALEATIKRLQHKEGKLQGGLGAPRWPLGCLVGFPYARPAWLLTASSQGLPPIQTCCASQRRRGCFVVHSAIAPSQTICQVAC